MKLERDLTEEELASYTENPEKFLEEENGRLERYLFRNNHIEIGKEVGCHVIFTAVALPERKVLGFYMDMTRKLFGDVPASDAGTSTGDGFENGGHGDALLDMTYDGKTGQYVLYALVPNSKPENIKVSKEAGVLSISAGEYRSRVKMPAGVKEIAKSYKDGVLEIRLR